MVSSYLRYLGWSHEKRPFAWHRPSSIQSHRSTSGNVPMAALHGTAMGLDLPTMYQVPFISIDARGSSLNIVLLAKMANMISWKMQVFAYIRVVGGVNVCIDMYIPYMECLGMSSMSPGMSRPWPDGRHFGFWGGEGLDPRKQIATGSWTSFPPPKLHKGRLSGLSCSSKGGDPSQVASLHDGLKNRTPRP